MVADLKARLADLERAARAAEGRDDDLAGMVAGLSRAVGALCRMLKQERPGTAVRLLAALDETEGDPVESYRERVTETMRSTLGCIQEFLLGVAKFTSPRIARAKWSSLFPEKAARRSGVTGVRCRSNGGVAWAEEEAQDLRPRRQASDMARLLATSETKPEPRLIRGRS